MNSSIEKSILVPWQPYLGSLQQFYESSYDLCSSSYLKRASL
uniref:Uncharacterized protein n=1 Tax=Anguilla anguilla TaxID=7936 RepID=A0A0E9VGH3_ANGAN